MKQYKFVWLLLAIFLLSFPVVGYVTPVHAVGGEVLCVLSQPASIGVDTIDSNDAEGQTFQLTGTSTIDAIKINLYRLDLSSGFASFNVSLTATSGGFPDLNTVLGTELFDTTVAPVYDLVTPANNDFSCSLAVDPTQVLIFDPPVVLNGGVSYALVVEGAGGMTAPDDLIWPYPVPGVDTYVNGDSWECNDPTACSKLSPATWDFPNTSIQDFSIALFGESVDGPKEVDQWLTNFLNQIGMNSVMGRLFIGAMVSGGIMIFLLWRGAPPLIALMMGGMFALPTFVSGLVSDAILLSMFAIIGLAIIFGILVGFRKGSGDNG